MFNIATCPALCRSLLLGSVLAVAACEGGSSTPWSALAVDRAQPVAAKTTATGAVREDQGTGLGGLPLGDAAFTPSILTPGPETGTAVGRRVNQLQSELRELQNGVGAHSEQLQDVRASAIDDAQGYYALVAAISARLQVGTTPGNPILVSQWTEAQVELDQITNDIARMNNLATQVAADNSLAAFLLESVRATYGLAGAVEQDHLQLRALEDEVSRTVVLIDRLLNELSDDVTRQTIYLNSERANLQTLRLAITNGELYGSSLANRTFISTAPQASLPPRPETIGPESGQRPLVVIRFDRPDVEYQQAVYQAVSRALERRPEAQFDLVAVSPGAGSASDVAISSNRARDHAEDVLRTLVDMGLPARRITLAATATDVQGNEVHLYVR